MGIIVVQIRWAGLGMIGKPREITRMSELLESLRTTRHDKIKVLERATARDVETYMRQNSHMSHDVIVVSSRK
jgi:hypothetical protein